MMARISWLLQKLGAVLLLALTMVVLSLAQLMVRLLPFRHYARWLRRPPSGPAAPARLARSLRHKIALGSRLLPWQPACLPQALAGRLILSVFGYASVLTLGTRDDGGDLAAHAWLKSGDLFISGRAEAARFGAVAEF